MANSPAVPDTIVPPAMVDCAIVALPSTAVVRPKVPLTRYAVAFKSVGIRGALRFDGNPARLMCAALPARSICVGSAAGPGATMTPLAVALPPYAFARASIAMRRPARSAVARTLVAR